MLWIEVARSPISSVRWVSRGTSILSDAPERIRSAASASRRKGRAIPSVSITDVMKAISTATPMNGTNATRSARMISSMSLASSTSTPTTADTRCTGIETEITRLPRSICVLAFCWSLDRRPTRTHHSLRRQHSHSSHCVQVVHIHFIHLHSRWLTVTVNMQANLLNNLCAVPSKRALADN